MGSFGDFSTETEKSAETFCRSGSYAGSAYCLRDDVEKGANQVAPLNHPS